MTLKNGITAIRSDDNFTPLKGRDFFVADSIRLKTIRTIKGTGGVRVPVIQRNSTPVPACVNNRVYNPARTRVCSARAYSTSRAANGSKVLIGSRSSGLTRYVNFKTSPCGEK